MLAMVGGVTVGMLEFIDSPAGEQEERIIRKQRSVRIFIFIKHPIQGSDVREYSSIATIL